MTFNMLAELSARRLRAILVSGGLQWPFALWLRFTLLGGWHDYRNRYLSDRQFCRVGSYRQVHSLRHGGRMTILDYLGLVLICLAAIAVAGICVARVLK